MLEELLGRDEVGQAREELGHVDEVHAGQDVLVKTQQAQRRAEQELLVVPAEHVPHPTRKVQRQRLTVQSEDPAGTGTRLTKTLIHTSAVYHLYTNTLIHLRVGCSSST